MKRLLFVLSALLLTACGGSSSGGGSIIANGNNNNNNNNTQTNKTNNSFPSTALINYLKSQGIKSLANEVPAYPNADEYEYQTATNEGVESFYVACIVSSSNAMNNAVSEFISICQSCSYTVGAESTYYYASESSNQLYIGFYPTTGQEANGKTVYALLIVYTALTQYSSY